MKYYSTRNPETFVTLQDAVLNGLAKDGGLYLPESINALPQSFWDKVQDMTYNQILIQVLDTLTQNDNYPRKEVFDELNRVFDFEPNIINLDDNRYLLDLNTGPTSAFKDYGANTLGAFLKVLSAAANLQKVVLVATSGDTGSAVANAFKDYSHDPSIKVIVLYPKGRVSEDQRKLMTTIGGNITCLEVEGNFDDCQKLVKQAMSDDSIRGGLTSANSINLIRLYGQVAYYIFAISRIKTKNPIIFSIPSGNLGNLTAGYISQLMGNPISRFIVSHNSNDMFNRFVLEGTIDPSTDSIPTISSAMDVYKPSNLERLISLYGGKFDLTGQITTLPDIPKIQSNFYVQGFDDNATRIKMKEIYDTYNLEICPHTAVGLLGVDHAITTEHPEFNDCTIITLSTAHASKFDDVFTNVIGHSSKISDPILEAKNKEERILPITNNYQELLSIIKKIT